MFSMFWSFAVSASTLKKQPFFSWDAFGGNNLIICPNEEQQKGKIFRGKIRKDLNKLQGEESATSSLGLKII
jgi:hypothetical protein